MQLSISHKGFV
ncbi:Bgt-20208-2 [Blumeria graminis f. sp. tritici]|uniref:Bgt-20208-2 n=1 Tax=Blumeria graminis f. sp. tritici TaxID=62690 RepID=A0A9X9L7Z0_BLUGR|nr:Bgt-20208-2 [Blumeria graminis f. sp. tritici]